MPPPSRINQSTALHQFQKLGLFLCCPLFSRPHFGSFKACFPNSTTRPRMNGPQPHASSSTSKIDLWSDILKSADRQNTLGRKNLLVLCKYYRRTCLRRAGQARLAADGDESAERHHGRKQLLERMVNATSGSERRKKEVKTGRGGLAMGYEVMEIRDDGDEGMGPTHHC